MGQIKNIKLHIVTDIKILDRFKIILKMDELMESDSDDDLLIPDFLSKTDTKVFKVLTPRKAIKPTRETLSPLPILQDKDGSEKKSKATISLLSLLTEKKKDDVVQQNV